MESNHPRNLQIRWYEYLLQYVNACENGDKSSEERIEKKMVDFASTHTRLSLNLNEFSEMSRENRINLWKNGYALRVLMRWKYRR